MTFENNAQQLGHTDPDDLDNNTSENPSMQDVLAARMYRRHVLKGGVGAMTMAGLGALVLSARSIMPDGVSAESGLGFEAVNKSLMFRVTVPEGYTASVIYATGDPLNVAASEYKNYGTDGNFASRACDHQDGIHYFGLSGLACVTKTI